MHKVSFNNKWLKQFLSFKFRQWMILLFCMGMIMAFFVCAKRLYTSAGHKITFDSVVLIVEAGKLILYLVYEFVFLHQSLLVIVKIVQTLIQFFIGVSFARKVLVIANRRRLEKLLTTVLLAVIFIVIFVALVLTFITGQINCNTNTIGYIWIILVSLSVCQSILIVACAVYLHKMLKSNQKGQIS